MWIKSSGSLTIVLSVVNLIYGRECDSVEILSYEELDKLENCTAILGNLEVNIEETYVVTYTSKEINSRKFPLIEVTGYAFFREMYMLDSLGGMFPNLTVIRGHRLLQNYALAIFQTGLSELSLGNLLKINRGSVRIGGSNPKLCLPKIDWSRIIVSGKFFTGKTAKGASCKFMRFERCNSCLETDYCWSWRSCQRFESFYQQSRHLNRTCHELCLGDCVNSTSRGCYTCKDKSEDSECVDECSETTLFNEETRRCVTEDECISSKKVIHEMSCVAGCPKGYSTETSERNETNHHCVQCDKCRKVCSPLKIGRISHLEAMGFGCTIIRGDLVIQFVEDVDNLTEMLRAYLGDVETIEGNLLIFRSSPITELTFLNNLEEVNIRENSGKTSSIQIYENQNLQKIFDWNSRGLKKLKMNGQIFIYNNNLLCSNETNRLKDIIEREASENVTDFIQNNGRSKCLEPSIEVVSIIAAQNKCKFQWKEVVFKSKSRASAYVIQFIGVKSPKAPDEQTLFERDSCSSHGWQHVLVTAEEWKRIKRPEPLIEFSLSNLTPSTYYAFQIQTYPNVTGAPNVSEIEGAISKVQYFTTTLKIPSRVQNFKTVHKTADSIAIKWDVVENEARRIKFFFIDVVKRPFDKTLIDSRNYCWKDPIEFEAVSPEQYESIEEERDHDACCRDCCERTKQSRESGETVGAEFLEELVKFTSQFPKNLSPRMAIKDSPNFVERIVLPNSANEVRNYTMKNLIPYTPYLIYISASSDDSVWSDYELLTETTEATTNTSFDRVEFTLSSYLQESQTFRAHFDEPTLVNGLIVFYILELRELVKNTSVLLMTDCVTRKKHEMNNNEYSLVNNLVPGTYLFRVVAVSLANAGKFDAHSEFINRATDHEFTIVKPESNFSKGWFVLIAVLLTLIGALAASYYYKHKITILNRKQNDTLALVKEMAPTDNFYEISLHHKAYEELSDNSEQGE